MRGKCSANTLPESKNRLEGATVQTGRFATQSSGAETVDTASSFVVPAFNGIECILNTFDTIENITAVAWAG